MRSARSIWTTTLVLGLLATGSHAGLRWLGKYCGVVVFDRWDACILYSGIYVMYVSEKAKEAVRPYAGQAVQIDAKEGYQPINPGDGLIRQFTFLGPAPTSRTEDWINLDGLALSCRHGFRDGEKPAVVIEVKNTGGKEVKVFSEELAPTLLVKDPARGGSMECWDGPSHALITRQGFWCGVDEQPRWKGWGFANAIRFSWTLGKESALPKTFKLKPGGKRKILIYFGLPPGEYDFLCGYGGGCHESKCLASNLVAFDVDKAGHGKVVKVEGR